MFKISQYRVPTRRNSRLHEFKANGLWSETDFSYLSMYVVGTRDGSEFRTGENVGLVIYF